MCIRDSRYFAYSYGLEVRESEKTICDAFVAKYGRLPVGNIQNPNTRNKIHGTEIDHFNTLFEIKD